jgi:prevent-host-death family protein
MGKITTVKARGNFSEVINRVAYGKERIVVTRRGKRLAALVPMEDLNQLEELENRIDITEAKKAWAEQGRKPGESWDKTKKSLGLK